jgi:DNA-binding NarL/FixJ family response regulator
MLKVILADDHKMVRSGIKMLLEHDQMIRVVAELLHGQQVIEYLEKGNEADIILADMKMPNMDGISLVKELKARAYRTKLMFLSMYSDIELVNLAFVEGAAGYLQKNISAEELTFAIKHVHNGKRYINAELAFSLLTLNHNVANLEISDLINTSYTKGEIDLLALIAEGKTNEEIAEKLYLSKRTVEGQRKNLIRKTGVRNTAALVRHAILNRLIR